MDDLIYASVTAPWRKRFKPKTVSSVEVIQAPDLERIEVVNPQLNAVVQLTAESALEEARQMDAA